MLVIIAALLAAVLALLVAHELRDRELSRVEWHAWMVRQQVVRVINEGADPALRVTIEAWDDDRMVRRWLPRLDAGEFWDLEFPSVASLMDEPAPGGHDRAARRRAPRADGLTHVVGVVQPFRPHRPEPPETPPPLVRVTWRSRRGRWSHGRVAVAPLAFEGASRPISAAPAWRPRARPTGSRRSGRSRATRGPSS